MAEILSYMSTPQLRIVADECDLQIRRSRIDPFSCDHSLCLSQNGNGDAVLTRLWWSVMLLLFAALWCFIAAGLWAYYGSGDFLSAPVIAPAVVGCGLLASLTFIEKPFVGRFLSQIEIDPSLSELHSHIVGIEPADTYGNMKVIGDDVGRMFYDHVSSRVIIEGVRYRYFICGDDVLRIENGPTKLGNGVLIELKVGKYTLNLVLSTRADFKAGDNARDVLRQRLIEVLQFK